MLIINLSNNMDLGNFTPESMQLIDEKFAKSNDFEVMEFDHKLFYFNIEFSGYDILALSMLLDIEYIKNIGLINKGKIGQIKNIKNSNNNAYVELEKIFDDADNIYYHIGHNGCDMDLILKYVININGNLFMIDTVKIKKIIGRLKMLSNVMEKLLHINISYAECKLIE